MEGVGDIVSNTFINYYELIERKGTWVMSVKSLKHKVLVSGFPKLISPQQHHQGLPLAHGCIHKNLSLHSLWWGQKILQSHRTSLGQCQPLGRAMERQLPNMKEINLKLWREIVSMFALKTSLQWEVVKHWCPKLILAIHIFIRVEFSIMKMRVVNGIKISGQVEHMVGSLL